MWKGIAIAMALLITACAPVTQKVQIDPALAAREAQIQNEMAVKQIVEMEGRLSDIYYPIQKANADLCGDTVALKLGIKAVTTDDLPKQLSSTYETLYSISRINPTILAIAKTSPAAGRLQLKDQVISINGVKGSAVLTEPKTMATPWVFEVLRDGESKTIELMPEQVCDYPASIQQEAETNAFADGKQIVVYTGMIGFAQSDEELALILSHELAHNTMGHNQKKRGNALAGALIGALLGGSNGADLGAKLGAGAYSQSFEQEADYVGTYYAARAGYRVDNAAMLWRRMGASNAGIISSAMATSHPSTPERFLAIEQTVQEIKTKKDSGLPLEPNLQKEKEEAPKPAQLNGLNS